MNKELNDANAIELTDNELEAVAGGGTDWNALMKYFQATAPSHPKVIELTYAIKAKDWYKAGALALDLYYSNPEKFAGGRKYF